MKLTSYLIFNGQAEEAASLYADVLGGKIENLYRYDSMPPTPEMPIPEECKQMIMHCCIIFPGGSMSMADTLPHDKRDFGNFENFKKENGYARATEIAYEYRLYRQNYCGCIYSKNTGNYDNSACINNVQRCKNT